MVSRVTSTGSVLSLIQGEGMEEQVYGKVTVRKFELLGSFAMAIGQLCADKDINAKVKFKLISLKNLLMEEAKKFSEIRDFYTAKKDAITEEEKKTFEEIANEVVTVDFEQIDVMLLINKLSVNDMEALRPILKGVK